MNQDDDDPTFCPRLRWAKVNGDFIPSTIIQMKDSFDKNMDILKFMEGKTVSARDIGFVFNLMQHDVISRLSMIRKLGVVMDTATDKGTGHRTYRVVSKPKNLRFKFPFWYNPHAVAHNK